jgi:hypothetical protein
MLARTLAERKRRLWSKHAAWGKVDLTCPVLRATLPHLLLLKSVFGRSALDVVHDDHVDAHFLLL